MEEVQFQLGDHVEFRGHDCKVLAKIEYIGKYVQYLVEWESDGLIHEKWVHPDMLNQ